MAVYGIVGVSRCRGGTGDPRDRGAGRFRGIDAPALHPAVFATAVMLLAAGVIAARVVMTRPPGRRAKPPASAYGGGPC